MDVAVLRTRIVATLDADADVRRRAELDLKAVRSSSSRILVKATNKTAQGRRPSWLHGCTSGYLASGTGSSNKAFK